ncbi:hypothetical protein SPBRAN_1285 [uncultured Candidatus Thioglobus sp.]|nr:hypothetical protein SPBRAN_1285 [uncultured Candidatus Thioglobus sp.]
MDAVIWLVSGGFCCRMFVVRIEACVVATMLNQIKNYKQNY